MYAPEGIVLESITVSGPRLRRMAVCGWAIRSVSWIRASRTGVSASQASNGMEAKCDVSDVLAAASGPYVDSSSSISRVALFFHSELLPRNVMSHDAVVPVALAPATSKPIIN